MKQLPMGVRMKAKKARLPVYPDITSLNLFQHNLRDDCKGLRTIKMFVANKETILMEASK